MIVHQSARAAITRCQTQWERRGAGAGGGLNNRLLGPHSTGGKSPRSKVCRVWFLVKSVFLAHSQPPAHWALAWPFPCVCRRERSLVSLPLLRGQQAHRVRAPSLRPPLTVITSLEALSPNRVTWGLRVSICELRRTQFSPEQVSFPILQKRNTRLKPMSKVCKKPLSYPALLVGASIESEKGKLAEHQARSTWAGDEASVTAGPGPMAGAAQRPCSPSELQLCSSQHTIQP